ncbi:MAG: DMT family transporter [Actinomycetota bacterium]|nr:DMT family transporter [Actinomycetota bacterium]
MLCALGSSLFYAVASVLQQKSASAEDNAHSLRLGLLTRLIQNPVWLLGVVADVAGFALQFIALGHGTLVVVQPLLVSGLLFALPIGAKWAGLRLHWQDWASAVAVCVGLSVFLTVARPAAGHNNVHVRIWVLLLTSATVVTAVLVVAALRSSPRRKAVFLSGAAGVIYGVAAALAKTSSHLLSRGVLHMLTHWQPYVLAVAGIVGMLVAQSAFQSGALDASLPTMTVVDPVVSIVIGAVAFGESIDSGLLESSSEILALLVMAIGVFILARSKAVLSVKEHPALP